MAEQRAENWSRRGFVGGLTLAGTVGLLGMRPAHTAAEPPPETTKVKLLHTPGICNTAPMHVAGELLPAEGFTEVQFVKVAGRVQANEAVASGETPFTIGFVGPQLIRIDAGDPIVILAGIHVGCFELFGTERVRSIRDLKGKTVGVTELGSGRHIFLVSLMAHIGLDPGKDVQFVVESAAESMRLLAEGKIDAYMGFPPDPQELRVKKIGRVLLNSTSERPWSQYFCCVVSANREFVRRNPIATKRVLRATLKAATICNLEPDRVAKSLVDRGLTRRADYARQTLEELPYNRWREYEPEDTVRFYALRLHEAGMIKSSPKKIIAQATDWRFLNELKKELKA